MKNTTSDVISRVKGHKNLCIFSFLFVRFQYLYLQILASPTSIFVVGALCFEEGGLRAVRVGDFSNDFFPLMRKKHRQLGVREYRKLGFSTLLIHSADGCKHNTGKK